MKTTLLCLMAVATVACCTVTPKSDAAPVAVVDAGVVDAGLPTVVLEPLPPVIAAVDAGTPDAGAPDAGLPRKRKPLKKTDAGM